jgi:hypothetical protein
MFMRTNRQSLSVCTLSYMNALLKAPSDLKVEETVIMRACRIKLG